MSSSRRADNMQERLELIRKLLAEDKANTQEAIRDWLEEHGHPVTQSTISRILRKLGAVRAVNEKQEAVYRLPNTDFSLAPAQTTFAGHVLEITSNGTMIVIRTTPGSAPLVARQLDRTRPKGILGTIAGDDTVFVAPAKGKVNASILEAIRKNIQG